MKIILQNIFLFKKVGILEVHLLNCLVAVGNFHSQARDVWLNIDFGPSLGNHDLNTVIIKKF